MTENSANPKGLIDPASTDPMFADLMALRYQIAAYLGGFTLLFIIGFFFSFDDSTSDSFLLFIPSSANYEFNELYTYTFLLQIVLLGAITFMLVRGTGGINPNGNLLLYLVSGYLLLSMITMLIVSISEDDISYDVIYLGLLVLGLAIAYYGYSYSKKSTISKTKRDKVMGLGALVYGFSMYISTHILYFDLSGDITIPAMYAFFGITTFTVTDGFFGIQTQTTWFYPTLQEWIFGGMLWIFIGAYFLLRGYSLGITEQDYFKFEDLIWILFSLSLFYFNFSTLLLVIQFGIANFATVILLLVNVIGIYLSYEVNFPLKEKIASLRTE